MDPEAQALQLRTAGVTAENIYRDLGVSGSLGANTRTGWHRLDGRLAQGDILVVAAIDRIGRRWMNTMQTIAYLSHRGVKIRSLSASERIWASYLEADPDTPEALIGHMLTIFISWCAQQEALSISQRTKAGLARARQNGKVIGRPTRMTADQIEAARWFRSAGISIRGIGRRMGVPFSTVHRALASSSGAPGEGAGKDG